MLLFKVRINKENQFYKKVQKFVKLSNELRSNFQSNNENFVM